MRLDEVRRIVSVLLLLGAVILLAVGSSAAPAPSPGASTRAVTPSALPAASPDDRQSAAPGRTPAASPDTLPEAKGSPSSIPSPSAGKGPIQPVYLLRVTGPVIPILATYLDRGIAEAEKADAICVIHLDTPGGLVSTMQVIVQRMLEARVPIVVYVAPQGAWAGSAGVFITYAAHVAAMAPGTNIGAAHPVSIGGGSGGDEPESEGKGKGKDAGKSKSNRDYMAEKSENHLASYIRSIAQRRGRNAKWGEEAVRKSVSLTVQEAVRQKVVDLEAASVPDLLRRIEGRKVNVAGRDVTLHPAPAVTREVPMTWAESFVFTISSPGLAALLMMLGTMGLMYELLNPGAILPGVVGVLCLLMGLYAMGQLPINYAGLALLLFSVILFVADLKLATHGALTIGGVISMVLGAVMLVPSGYPYLAISWATIAAMVVFVGGGFFLLAFIVASSLRKTAITGSSSMVDTVARALTDLSPEGQVRVRGEIWQARALGDKILAGQSVKIKAVEDFTVVVEALPVSTRADSGE